MDNHVIHNPLRHQKQPPVKIQVSPTATTSPPCFLITDRDPAVSHFHSCRPKAVFCWNLSAPSVRSHCSVTYFGISIICGRGFSTSAAKYFLSYPPFFFIDKPFNIRYLHPPWCTNQKFRSALPEFFLSQAPRNVCLNESAGRI